MWINDNDFLCNCGSFLRNTCPSAIKNHRHTNKHKNLIKGELALIKKERKKKDIKTLQIIRKQTIIIWD